MFLPEVSFNPLTIVNTVFFMANLSFFAFANRKGILSLIEAAGMATSVAGWKYTVLIAAFVVKLRLQQWWGKNIEKIDDGKYVLSHVINNQEVKVIVNTIPRETQPSKILTEDRYDITDYAIPFFRVSPEEVSPGFFFEDLLIITDNDGKEAIAF